MKDNTVQTSRPFYKSGKFWVLILGIGAVILCSYFDYESAILAVAGMVASYIAGNATEHFSNRQASNSRGEN